MQANPTYGDVVGEISEFLAEVGERARRAGVTKLWLDPGIVVRSDQLAMDIDIDHGPNYGATVSWPPAFAPGLGEPTVTAVQAIDIHRLERLFVSLIQAPNPAP